MQGLQALCKRIHAYFLSERCVPRWDRGGAQCDSPGGGALGSQWSLDGTRLAALLVGGVAWEWEAYHGGPCTATSQKKHTSSSALPFTLGGEEVCLVFRVLTLAEEQAWGGGERVVGRPFGWRAQGIHPSNLDEMGWGFKNNSLFVIISPKENIGSTAWGTSALTCKNVQPTGKTSHYWMLNTTFHHRFLFFFPVIYIRPPPPYNTAMKKIPLHWTQNCINIWLHLQHTIPEHYL